MAARRPSLRDSDGLPYLRGLPLAAVLGRRDQQFGGVRDAGEVGDRPVAAVGQQHSGSLVDVGRSQGLVDGGQHGGELWQVVGLLVSAAATTTWCSVTIAWAL
jgi:hypothetical protein